MDLATPHGADLEFRDLNKTDDCPCPQVATTEIKKKEKEKANRVYKNILQLVEVL